MTVCLLKKKQEISAACFMAKENKANIPWQSECKICCH